MTATIALSAVSLWLALQIPMGMAVGWYIRKASALAEARVSAKIRIRPRALQASKKGRYPGHRPALLMRG
jgi:hypothetical protein